IEILELRGERWLGLDQFGPGPTLIGAEMQFGNLWFDLDRQTKQGRYGTGGVACALERASHDDIGTDVAVDVGGDSGGLLDPVLIERDIGTADEYLADVPVCAAMTHHEELRPTAGWMRK